VLLFLSTARQVGIYRNAVISYLRKDLTRESDILDEFFFLNFLQYLQIASTGARKAQSLQTQILLGPSMKLLWSGFGVVADSDHRGPSLVKKAV
jgi:hypothetical protein